MKNIYVASSKLKKFHYLDGYRAEAYSAPSFLKHCALHFRKRDNTQRYSEFELFEAWRMGKLRLSVYTYNDKGE